MAGDVGFKEARIVSMAGEPARGPFPLLHDYGPQLAIAMSGIAASEAEDAFAAAAVDEDALSENERFGLQALRLRETDGYATAKSARPYDDLTWGAETGGPGRLHKHDDAFVSGFAATAAIAPAPASRRLKGRIGVGIVIVSGPGALSFSPAEQVKVAAEVQNGLSWLGGQAPARDVTWVHDTKHVILAVADTTADPPPGSGPNQEYEHYEKPWRDAALAQLGCGPGMAGVNQYVAKLRSALGVPVAYCAFFVKYTLNHFAYCSGPYLTMHYLNDGWGTENLDRVFAHETGHVFGAPDEYAPCHCGGSHGHYGKPNLNCESCAAGGGVDCIMKANSWAMCDHTFYHLGFDMSGVPVAAAPAPSPA